MSNYFQDSLDKGKIWEQRLEHTIPNWYKPSAGWAYSNTSQIYRDKDGDKMPDFVIFRPGNWDNSETKMIDAKYKKWYHDPRKQQAGRFFTMDQSFTTSYRNIHNKTGIPVFIAFFDDRDPEHTYVLDVTTPEDFIHTYNNQYDKNGTNPAYHWDLLKMKKVKI